jgi:VWFA-related protein
MNPARTLSGRCYITYLAARAGQVVVLSSGLVLFLSAIGWAQQPAEITSRQAPSPVFRTEVKLVTVPVVVRDQQGRAIGDLRQQDFQLLDKGKPQEITRFSVEKLAGQEVPAVPGAAPETRGEITGRSGRFVVPERFVAYLFDDVHLSFGDLVQVRDAAGRQMTSLQPADRAAIYSTSGRTMLEFTDDRDRWHETLLRLRSQPIARYPAQHCPEISYYMADLIVRKKDATALKVAAAEVLACGLTLEPAAAPDMALRAASQVLSAGDQEAHVSLTVLNQVVGRMSALPGERILLLVSPGFLASRFHEEEVQVIDRAIRAGVIVNSLDARGLYADPTFRADTAYTRRSRSDATYGSWVKDGYNRETAATQIDLLAELSAGTGGTFFGDSNDLEGGFKRLANAPEYYYMLGFSPQALKADGAFHPLKVTLRNPRGLSLSARSGYYATKDAGDEAGLAEREIGDDALYSRKETHGLPVELQAQWSKGKAPLSVLARLDAKAIGFRKAEGRHRTSLTFIYGLFDRNGTLVQSLNKTLDFNLKDETLAEALNSGLKLRTNFDAGPGCYMVRLLIRDSKGQLVSADNLAVDMP